jgi:6-phosphogluconolactonase (cycloisomerase 2 family)
MGAFDAGGKFLYIPGSGAGTSATLTGYAIDQSTGALSAIPGMPISFPLLAPPASVFAPTFDRLGRALYIGVSQGLSLSSGLYTYSIDQTTGVLTSMPGSPRTSPSGGPRRGTLGAMGDYLYVPFGLPAPGPNPNGVTAFGVNQATGALTGAGSTGVGTPAAGVSANELAAHPSGRFVYSRNSDGTAGIFRVGPTGVLNPPTFVPVGSGDGIVFGSAGRFAYFMLPGSGSIAGYGVDAATGALSALPGSPYATNGSGANFIQVDPTGQYVVATNVASGTIAVFAINVANGTLSHVAGSPFSPAVGTTPGAVAFDPSGRAIYVTDSGTSSVSAYAVTAATGVPIFIGSGSTGASPTVFVRIAGLQ